MLQEKWYPLTWMFCSHVKGALNISSSKPKAQLSDNHTIQEFVKDYVDEYVGEYSIISHVNLLFCYFLKFVNMFLYMFFSFVIQGELNISSSQTPDNRTIQNFVKDYVKEYVGGYNFTSHVSLPIMLLLEFVSNVSNTRNSVSPGYENTQNRGFSIADKTLLECLIYLRVSKPPSRLRFSLF